MGIPEYIVYRKPPNTTSHPNTKNTSALASNDENSEEKYAKTWKIVDAFYWAKNMFISSNIYSDKISTSSSSTMHHEAPEAIKIFWNCIFHVSTIRYQHPVCRQRLYNMQLGLIGLLCTIRNWILKKHHIENLCCNVKCPDKSAAPNMYQIYSETLRDQIVRKQRI